MRHNWSLDARELDLQMVLGTQETLRQPVRRILYGRDLSCESDRR